jgi:diguanylate cyclase (GGDEF)-like protein/PAS domain S-box-containing protein
VQAQAQADSPIPVDLLQQLAAAHAEAHDFESAYRYGQAAEEARRRLRLTEAENHLQAMSIRHEVTRAHADTERHKRLAAKLQATADTLERLGSMGREITASLDAHEVGHTVMRHASELLEVRTFYLYTMDGQDSALVRLVVENRGEAQPFDRIALDTETSLLARCARERREIVIEREAAGASKSHLPGTLPSLSLLFFPLEVAGRLLGVMSVQSAHAGAYGERELAIFRTLCAWAAIGLDNAAAYEALASQEQELRVAAAAFESQLAMFITDANGTILRVNQACERFTGYKVADLVGRHPSLLLPESLRVATLAQWRAALAANQGWEGESLVSRSDGQEVPTWISVAAVREASGEISHIIVTGADMAERKRAEEEIRQLAFFDPLTNLPNRRLLMDRLAHALTTSARNGSAGAMLFLDLDKFKTLNDTRGHDVGDQLLAQVGLRLCKQVRESDTVARLGGDEFVVLLEGLGAGLSDAAEQADHVARKIQLALSDPYVLSGQQHHSSPSIGVSLFKGQAVGVDDLLRQADLAMYQAKAAGRNTVRFFDPTMQAAVSAHAQLEADLRSALAQGQFELHHQAQVDMQGRITGTEALLRWRHPERGMVSPADFIPVAEESGLILPLGQWVLETAVRSLEHWAKQPALAGLSVAVNISARQFHSPQFVPQVLALLDGAAIEPKRLKLELTESLLLENVDSVIEKMHALKARGVRFSLDDFGTGYSSLSYLKRLPLQELKIDQSFVRDIFVDDNDVAIVRAIVTLGQSLGLQVIAEGVETADQREFLANIGCQAYQGYLFARPMPVSDFEARALGISV